MISGPFVGQKRESLARRPYTGYFIKEYVNVITASKKIMPQIFATLQSFLTKILPFDITKGALGSLGLNVIYQCLLLAIMALLTRLMDISGFGQYSVVMAIIVLVGLPFAGGMPVFMLRHVSAYYVTQDYAKLTGLLRRSFIWVSLGTILLTFLVSIIISVNKKTA